MLSLGVFAKRCVVARRFHRGCRQKQANPVPRARRDVQRAKPEFFDVAATHRHAFGAGSDAFSTSREHIRAFFFKKT